MKVVLLLLVTLGLSTAQDCMSTYFNERCLPKAEAGWAAHHSALFQDGDPCFTYASYGSMCYVGGGVLHPCDMTAPGCSGSGWSATTTTTQAPVVNGGGDCPNQAAYCALGDDNTMCKYCGIGDTCNDQVITNEMTDAMKTELLDKHNELRAKVANGEEDGQPSAQNMNKLEWDDELARNAQLWADQCPDQSWVKTTNPPHDQDRRTIVYDGSIGQNMATSWSSDDRKDWKDWKSFLNSRVQRWYNEVGYWPAANVGSFSKYAGNGKAIGHYTQVVWAETKKVGCGVIYYKDPNKIHQGWKLPYRKVTT